MQLELVTIGTELLLGFTIDSNSAHIGRILASAGIRVARRTTVPDDAEAIRSAVSAALARTGTVLTTGGLGPTRDDLSKTVVADVFGWPLRFNASVWEDICARFRRMGREPSPANRCQAEVPEGAQVLANQWGTAPGLWFEGEPGLVIMLPGVPREMRKLLDQAVMPKLMSRGSGRVIRSAVVRTTGIPESTLGARVAPVEDELAPLTLEALRRRGWHLSVAESCTGGMLGERLTAIAGSSDVFVGGAISYDNSLKTSVLGVPADLLASHGAVSIEVARAMADGAASRFGTEVSVGVTGIAGPSGGTPDKPVGTVCFGWVVGNQREATRVVFPGSRREIRERAVQFALHRLWRLSVGD